MSKYEAYIDSVENSELDNDTSNAAADALAFVLSLHEMFKENGVNLPVEPDVSLLENVIDGVMGELAAASIFLAEDSFKKVPDILRGISSTLTTSFEEDPNSGEEVKEKVTPTVVIKGFSRLANRIEATRIQQWQMKELLTG